MFYYLIDLHYSQTFKSQHRRKLRFYYLIDLHYSQTVRARQGFTSLFYYLIDLHYSQTTWHEESKCNMFYYLIDLHYSQTLNMLYYNQQKVLLPYRFTLFSNVHLIHISLRVVLLPYRFTLFSNLKLGIKCTHYTVHGKSIRIFYNICIMIVNKIRTNHYQSQQVFRIQKLLSALSFQC